MAASASAFGTCGGWISATRRFPAFAKIGSKSRSMPTPGWLISSSDMLLTGHPPEGSCRLRIGWPVSITRVFDLASWDARQIEG
jgi:hypothetical protein